MSTKLFCPIDGSLMENIGDHGIIDYDGNWDAQASRYECSNKELCNHTIFFIDSDCIVDPDEGAFDAAQKAIQESLAEAMWEPESEPTAAPSSEGHEEHVSNILLMNGQEFGPTFESLDDLRDELAKRALAAFKKAAVGTNEYEYIHAIEDVDDILSDYETKLKELGWLREG